MFGDKLLIIRLGSFIDGTAGGGGNVDTRMVEDDSYADYLGNRFGKRLFYFAVRDIKAGELIEHAYWFHVMVQHTFHCSGDSVCCRAHHMICLRVCVITIYAQIFVQTQVMCHDR